MSLASKIYFSLSSYKINFAKFYLRSFKTHRMANHHATISYVTAPNEDIARQLSNKLVEKRLAACVNILKGVESVYEWQGKIEHDNEVLMVIKSFSDKSVDLADFVTKNHPYDCPEVITTRVESGSEKYLKWVEETIKKQPLAE